MRGKRELWDNIPLALSEMVNSASDPLEVEESHVFLTIASSMPVEYYVYEK